MKTDYEYITFKGRLTAGRTTKWYCNNKHHGERLGEIKWHGPWRAYCYFPLVQAIYSKGCLADITDFINQLMEERKK